VRSAWKLLDRRCVPNYSHPDRAVNVIEALYDYTCWRDREPHAAPAYKFDEAAIRRVIRDARKRGSKALAENEARKIAQACGIPVPRTVLASTADAAVEAARKIGFPVVLKISSEDILHKSDAGGVKVGVVGEEAVRGAFRQVMESSVAYKADARLDGVLVQEMAPKGGRETIIGVSRDPQFGPVIMFGLGGVYVEVLKDVTFRVAPLTLGDAREMIEGIRSAMILRAFRGDPACDLGALAECLTRVSQLAVQFPELIECDFNPVKVYAEGKGLMALDVRFGLE